MKKEDGKEKVSFDNDKYKNKWIRFQEKDDHYELIFADEFIYVASSHPDDKESTVILDVVSDLREADKNKELHIFMHSCGGYVDTLTMLLQEITLFKHRVGICASKALSCGFLILTSCHELYVNNWSSLLHHDISSMLCGKLGEMKNDLTKLEQRREMLWEACNIRKFITDEEFVLSKTSEVWLSGKDLIDRGVAKPYQEYTKRIIPAPLKSFYEIDGKYYKREKDGTFTLYITKENLVKLTYAEMIDNLRSSENDK